MILIKLTSVFILGVAALPIFSANSIADSSKESTTSTFALDDEGFNDAGNVTEFSSNPPGKERTTTPSADDDKGFHDPANVTLLPKSEKEDIVSTLAAEFLFLIAEGHVFLPEPSDLEEDRELHRNAQILANLLTRLNCTRRVYNLLNSIGEEIGVPSWTNEESSSERHLFTEIFNRVIEELQCDRVAYREFLREESKLKNEPLKSSRVDGNRVTSSEKKTFYDITSVELSAVEELLDSQLIKKVMLTVELLQKAEESLDAAPQSAQTYRKRLETAKAVFNLAESKNIETRRRIQKAFDEALNEAVEHFEVAFGNLHQDVLCDSLYKKIEADEVLKKEFHIY